MSKSTPFNCDHETVCEDALVVVILLLIGKMLLRGRREPVSALCAFSCMSASPSRQAQGCVHMPV
jgi:hypothetical protein